MKMRTFAADKRNRTHRSQNQRQRFFKKNHGKCWYCGQKVKSKGFRLEHQTPFSKGGSCQLAQNMVIACEPCDIEKRNMTVEEFRAHRQKQQPEPVQFYGERHNA